MTLDEIKNDHAIKMGFDNWNQLRDQSPYIGKHENKVMRIAQRECLRLASENAKVIIDYKNNVDYAYLEKTIIDDNNIIK